jgi:hypothetical protein
VLFDFDAASLRPAYSNMIQLQALIELLREKGLLAQQEISDRMKRL